MKIPRLFYYDPIQEDWRHISEAEDTIGFLSGDPEFLDEEGFTLHVKLIPMTDDEFEGV